MSNAYLFFAIATFYTLLFVAIGFIGTTFEEVTIVEEEGIDVEVNTGGFLNWLIGAEIPLISTITSFLKSIVVGISVLPIWANTLIFTPLILAVTYLIIDLVWIG